jgi:predicted dithiol-disulfide oxidoreductase (DUF899 family)
MQRRIASRDEWLAERKQLLAREKEFTRLRDELSAQRRTLPWVGIDKEYVFEGPNGPESLADLFDGRNQLIVYHFMFGSDWEQGCPSCSFISDHFDPMLVHLAHRDVTMGVVSRAPIERIEGFRKRMGWQFHWVSSFANDFNLDFNVSFPLDGLGDTIAYNYTDYPKPADPTGSLEEGHGISVFARDADGAIYHTYSSYARGCDLLIGTYNFLDLVPKGRDEDGLPFPMTWLRHHDRYDDYRFDPEAGYPMPVRDGKASCCN